MKYKIILLTIIISFFVCQSIFSQQRAIDSLQTLLKTTREDTNKVNILNGLCGYYINDNPNQALVYNNEAHKLAIELKYNKGEADSYNIIGYMYDNQYNYSEALSYFNKALCLYEKIDNKYGMMCSYNNIGFMYNKLENYTKALDYHKKVLKLRIESGDKRLIGKSYNIIGDIYFYQKEYSKALVCYYKTLKIGKELKFNRGISASYNRIGTVYLFQKKYKKALGSFFKAIKIAEEIEYKPTAAMAYGNIGEMYHIQKKYLKALYYYFKSLKLYDEVHDNVQLTDVYINIGNIYYEQSNYKKALTYYNKGLILSKELENKKTTRDIYEKLSEIYFKVNDLKKAYDLYDLYFKYYDSINNAQSNMDFNNKEYEYEREEKMLQIKSQEYKIKRQKVEAEQKYEKGKQLYTQKIVYVAGLCLLSLIVVIIFAGYMMKIRDNKIITKEKQRSEDLLLNILPSEIAKELKQYGEVVAQSYNLVTVLFTDFKDFTKMSKILSPESLVNEIDYCFMEFDRIIGKYEIEKIKITGDVYMCAGGLPIANTHNPVDVVKAGLEIQKFMETYKIEKEKKGQPFFEIRLGIHTGRVVAGIVGVKKFAYDIWGDTVNIASRMESSGEAGKVNISGHTYELVKEHFACTCRGKIKAKNKGEIDMYFVNEQLSISNCQ